MVTSRANTCITGVCVRVGPLVCVCVCLHACMHVCVRECMHAHVCLLKMSNERGTYGSYALTSSLTSMRLKRQTHLLSSRGVSSA